MGRKCHLAQVNIARARDRIDAPVMQGFVAQLDAINALADSSPGFVWRLQTEEGNATALQPFEDERILVNLSVWESPDHLREFVYRSAHAAVMRQRREWFERFEGMYMALWWIAPGHTPTVTEAKERLRYLQEHGESEFAFTFRSIFAAPGGKPAGAAVRTETAS